MMNYFKKFAFVLLTALVSLNSFGQGGNKGICNVQLEGQEFVIHVVELGETLYSISKKYSTPMSEVWKYNPTIVDSVIVPGQILKIPFNEKIMAPKPPITKTDVKPTMPPKNEVKPQQQPTTNNNTNANTPKPTNNINATVTPKPIKFDSTKIVYHLVEKGQTLYGISRTYNQPVEKIVEWNNLGENPNIQVGQKLIVSPFGAIKIIDEEKKEVKEIKPSTEPVKTKVALNDQQDFLFEEYQKQKSNSKTGAKSERGTAAWLETGNPMMKSNYFCLHKTAPIGTIVKVTNLVNQRYVLLKVIGKLPETGENENVILRISPAARKDGVFMEGKNYTQVDYYNN